MNFFCWLWILGFLDFISSYVLVTAGVLVFSSATHLYVYKHYLRDGILIMICLMLHNRNIYEIIIINNNCQNRSAIMSLKYIIKQ